MTAATPTPLTLATEREEIIEAILAAHQHRLEDAGVQPFDVTEEVEDFRLDLEGELLNELLRTYGRLVACR